MSVARDCALCLCLRTRHPYDPEFNPLPILEQGDRAGVAFMNHKTEMNRQNGQNADSDCVDKMHAVRKVI